MRRVQWGMLRARRVRCRLSFPTAACARSLRDGTEATALAIADARCSSSTLCSSRTWCRWFWMFTGGRQRQRIPGRLDVGSRSTFELGWLEREPYRSWLPAFREQVRALDTWPSPEAYDCLARVGRSASAPVVL